MTDLYDLANYEITIKGNEIVDICHNEFPTGFWEITKERRQEIEDKAISFVKGEVGEFYVWSDYDHEEWSTDFYISLHNGYLKVHNHTDSLIKAIHTKQKLYRVMVDDNLF